MARPEVGGRFAHFYVYSELGRGGMGVVFAAYDTRSRRVVALKLLPIGLAGNADYRRRFLREAAVARGLRSPHVLRVLDAGEHDDELWLAMELLAGQDLAAALTHEGPLRPDRALRVMDHVSHALDEAHGRGLVHRDVKPANIFLVRTAHGEHAYLGDFGIARRTTPEATALTRPGALVGTYDYMSPEAVLHQKVDARSDVYSLACTLYHALAGRPPFTATTPYLTLGAHVIEPAPPLRGLNPTIGARLDAAVRAGLRKEPASRPQSASGYVRLCTDAFAADSASRSPATPDGDVTRRRWSRRQRG